MSPDTTEMNSELCSDEWVKSTSLFRKWDSMKEEIILHKWYESERRGYDIGWDRAYTDWLIHHGMKSESSQTTDA